MIYTVQRVERKTENKYTNLWVALTVNGEARQFTAGDQHDGSARWSPDGKRIAFLSDRGDKEKPAQIYLIPFSGGEAQRLTQIEGEIDGMSWSSDGRQIVCTVRKKDAEVLEREKDEQKKKLGVDCEMVRFPDEFHGLSRTGRTDRKIVRLNHILRWFDKYLKA